MSPRFLVVNRTLAGRTVLELLRSHFHLTPVDVRQLLKHKGIHLAGAVCHDLTRRVRTGQKLRVDDPGSRPNRKQESETRSQESEFVGQESRAGPRRRESTARSGQQKIDVVYVDQHVIVVEKPAGLTTVRHASERAEFGDRAQRFLPATLLDLLASQQQGRFRAVHRLDKETSGLVVLARTSQAERGFGLKFREHDVERTYLALVRGQAKSETITSHFVRDRGDGRRGSSPDERGQKAVTHVKVVEELDGFTLVECRLETGRTHQVRIHLGEQGTPLCGERVYDRPVNGQPLPDGSGAARPALHAATLSFEHPVTKKRLSFESPLPEDMRKLVKRLRESD